MKLYFRNKTYLDKAILLAKSCPDSAHTPEEAFLLLIHGASKGQLENLLGLMEQALPGMSPEECYALTQCPEGPEKASRILTLAYDCLDSGKPLGTELVNGRHNASDWIGHSLLEGKLCGQLAVACGLDAEKARRLGMLHDYGRRSVHTLEHTVRGFELLVDQGWEQEALGCLTHSFLCGGRCASNESAEPGFYVDDNGNPCWAENAEKDDVTVFLEHYEYTEYDIILNIADLMTTSHAIVSPRDRIADIATRRTIDPTNRGYFLAELTNQLNRMRQRITGDTGNVPEIKAKKGVSLEEITDAFERVSEMFFEAYQEIGKRN